MNLTTDDFNEIIFSSAARKILEENINQHNALVKQFMAIRKSEIAKQSFGARVKIKYYNFCHRVSNAAKVLRGKAFICECEE